MVVGRRKFLQAVGSAVAFGAGLPRLAGAAEKLALPAGLPADDEGPADGIR